ncbi:diaminopimelate epimerase [Pseudothermotoga hypogea]|uniref:diaminopimelate epimerase n=1 Tax=Pseudothermotoga hypogea TaxID=57487 RepID=UPI000403EF20|nr:diaminopimelate epimerase [Pseudothermotoga hypogea]
MKIKFFKMNGAGNDFIVIDNRENALKDFDISHFVRMVCRRGKSIGADGLMLLERSDSADFKMRYFNSDGSEGEMCGNGARCIARFANLMNVAKEHMRFETIAGIHEAVIVGEEVQIMFPDLKVNDFKLLQRHDFGFGPIEYHFGTVGVPHVVIFRGDVESMEDELLLNWGRKIRYALDVFPRGTNVNFVKVVGPSHIIVRTYERGVENETLACGTGSIASSIVSFLIHAVEPPVTVKVRGGELKVGFERCADEFKNVYLQGDARVVAEGYILPDAWKE